MSGGRHEQSRRAKGNPVRRHPGLGVVRQTSVVLAVRELREPGARLPLRWPGAIGFGGFPYRRRGHGRKPDYRTAWRHGGAPDYARRAIGRSRTDGVGSNLRDSRTGRPIHPARLAADGAAPTENASPAVRVPPAPLPRRTRFVSITIVLPLAVRLRVGWNRQARLDDGVGAAECVSSSSDSDVSAAPIETGSSYRGTARYPQPVRPLGPAATPSERVADVAAVAPVTAMRVSSRAGRFGPVGGSPGPGLGVRLGVRDGSTTPLDLPLRAVGRVVVEGRGERGIAVPVHELS